MNVTTNRLHGEIMGLMVFLGRRHRNDSFLNVSHVFIFKVRSLSNKLSTTTSYNSSDNVLTVYYTFTAIQKWRPFNYFKKGSIHALH